MNREPIFFLKGDLVLFNFEKVEHASRQGIIVFFGGKVEEIEKNAAQHVMGHEEVFVERKRIDNAAKRLAEITGLEIS